MSVELHHTIEHRKSQGIYYTPEFLAKFLAKEVVKLAGSFDHVLDPACGDAVLLESLLKETPISKGSMIHGIDLDERAVKAAKNRINGLTSNSEFFQTDGLYPKKGTSTSRKSWESFKANNEVVEGYDVIVSNPPWGADLQQYSDGQLKNCFEVAQGQFNSYDLFVESIIENLKEGGVYGLIIPDSIFNKEHAPLRKVLYSKTSIHLIARLGEKIFSGINRSCAVIVGVKNPLREDHSVHCLKLTYEQRNQVLKNSKSLSDVLEKDGHYVRSKRFVKDNFIHFDIDLRENESKIIEKIEKSGFVTQDFVTNSRGAEISKKGMVCQCPNCSKWMPLPKSDNPICQHCSKSFVLDKVSKTSIVLNHNGTGNVKFKSGEDLFRFTSRSKSWLNTTKDGINYKSAELYSSPKILVR